MTYSTSQNPVERPFHLAWKSKKRLPLVGVNPGISGLPDAWERLIQQAALRLAAYRECPFYRFDFRPDLDYSPAPDIVNQRTNKLFTYWNYARHVHMTIQTRDSFLYYFSCT